MNFGFRQECSLWIEYREFFEDEAVAEEMEAAERKIEIAEGENVCPERKTRSAAVNFVPCAKEIGSAACVFGTAEGKIATAEEIFQTAERLGEGAEEIFGIAEKVFGRGVEPAGNAVKGICHRPKGIARGGVTGT
jgi:hypothetical protein